MSAVTCQSNPPTVLIGLEHLFALLQFLVTGLKCFLQLPYLHYMYRWGDALSTRGGHEEMYVHTNKGYIYTYIYVYCDPSNTCYNWNSQGNCTSEMIERDQAKTCGPLSISHLASAVSLTIPLCKNQATQTFSTRHATTVMHLCIPAFILSR